MLHCLNFVVFREMFTISTRNNLRYSLQKFQVPMFFPQNKHCTFSSSENSKMLLQTLAQTNGFNAEIARTKIRRQSLTYYTRAQLRIQYDESQHNDNRQS